MSSIRVMFMKEEAIETLLSNSKKVTEFMKTNPQNSSFLKEIYKGELYEPKRYKFNYIDFDSMRFDKDSETAKEDECEIAIKIYETLKHLPRYILTNRGFWMWFEFEVAFKLGLKLIPIKSDSTFPNMWAYKDGKRRGNFFNVFAREFFRVALTIDETKENKYEYTRFIFDYIYRFREYTWRINSDRKNNIFPAIKAAKDLYDKYPDFKEYETNLYTEAAKQLSLYGSAHLLDSLEFEDIYEYMYNKIEQLYLQRKR